MAIAAFVVGVLGGLLIAQVNFVAGVLWFAACVVGGLSFVLDNIAALLKHQKSHYEWFERLEVYRFNKQFPNAAKEWKEQELAKQAAKEQPPVAAEPERPARKEPRRKAEEPTFVSRELVPEIPADFKPKSDVDFSALDEVTKPRRKRE